MIDFSVPTREQIYPGNEAAFDTLQRRLGMVPNLYATIAYSENGLNKYLAFQTAKTSLYNREREAVSLVMAQVNGCRYCQSVYTSLGRKNGISEEELMAVRTGSSSHPRLNALAGLAKEIAENKGRASIDALERFFEAGYDKGNLVDLILQISDNIAMNYLCNLTQIEIDFPLAPELAEGNNA
ncbi:alkylhydroperoxidase AhpD family core domain-containing protein [Chitinophaga sp. YR627]|uniref:carboxymuconolactone decarboxylase family protein n=1 Tax=Chitinophaga sp. YR627 TaxID=1881041 RepID=UPI0008DF5DBC|nr:carboxymuconolactone decarboxylase family protein [Chitinophaga sp. YR627]SFO83132.1 alkylhydroperoxidase AhpD family core domain-containing protein [Chitinophaga sp. YR627]